MPVPLIQICGDPTVDWLAIRQEREPGIGPYFWKPEQKTPVGLSVQAGGSALLTDFVKTLLPACEATVDGVELDPALLRTPTADITRSWTLWQQGDDKHAGFRIAEWTTNEPCSWSDVRGRRKGAPQLLVIEDSGLGFRDAEEKDWPEALSPSFKTPPEQILLKLSICSAGEKSPVLDCIRKRGLADRTTIVVSVKDIRTCAVRVSESLSWERMLEHVRAAVLSKACPFVDPEKPAEISFARVVVTIGASGAAIISNSSTALVFDRFGQEGDFERRFKGEMMGYNTCLMGALAAQLIRNGNSIKWTGATSNGLALARLLHVEGFEITSHRTLRFPYDALARAYEVNREGGRPRPGEKEGVWDLGVFEMTSSEFLKLLGSTGKWTILKCAVLGGAAPSTIHRAELMQRVHKTAERIAIKGPRAVLKNVPLETIGKWRSADRSEIEGVRSVKNAMQEYLNRKGVQKPLAIAVFGPPGAGKSFAVKEMAQELGIGKDEQLTFNLSQFESPDELAAAFHQIQDLHLQGKRPLVFWDEFDTPCESRPLGWLRYFLAPIQDAQFSEHGRVHPTGGGIYVFAGGTRFTYEQFVRMEASNESAAKKPDFISRLRAHIDVRGPNGVPDLVQDDLYVVRRAFMLNSILERDYPHLKKDDSFQFGGGVLETLLHTLRYRHGVRSMESIVAMSSLKGRKVFEQSSFPPEPLLSMHVNPDDFISLAQNERREMLRVGITGHIGLDPERTKLLEAAIDKAISGIEYAFPNRWLTAFSPLAKGSDRMVARRILNREGSRLIAVLPMSREEYVQDFGPSDSHREDYEGADSRQEFRYWLDNRAVEIIVMPPTATREESYEREGFYVAQHCDVMIAVYDGRPAQGRGGTAHIVAKARELKKPLCQVWAGNYKADPAKRTEPERDFGTITYENFPPSTS